MPLVLDVDYNLVSPNDTLNAGRLKWNNSISAIVDALNEVEGSLISLTPEQVNGLLQDGHIHPDLLPDTLSISASGVTFSSPNYASPNVQGALEEIYTTVSAIDSTGEAANITIEDADDNFVSTHVEGALEELYLAVANILSSGGDGNVLGPVTSTDGNIVVFDGTTGKLIKDSGLSATSFAAASHSHNANEITTGTLEVARGGTGISSYTSGNFLRASGATTLEQRTPAQVRSDIGAMATSGGTFTGTVTFNAGIIANSSMTVNNNSPIYLRTQSGTPLSILYMSSANLVHLGDIAVPMLVETSAPITVKIGLNEYTMLTSGDSINSLADVNTSGATVNQVLTWNGSQWIPATVSGGGGGDGDYLPLTGGTITGSLSISGREFLSAGTAATPSLSITGDTDTGIYSPGEDQLGISLGGTQRFNLSTSGARVGVSGSAAAPSWSFISDSDTGIYNSDTNTLSVATGGASRAHFSSAGMRFQGAGSAGTPVLSIQSDQDTGLYFPAADSVAITTGGAQRVLVNNSGLFVSGQQVLTTGSNISSLANVSTATANTGDVLTFDGTIWSPAAPTGGGGGISNPLVADLNANGYQIKNPRIVGNQDVPINATSLIVANTLNLTTSFNSYYIPSLTSNLTVVLPTVTGGSAPYGYITIKLNANVSVNVTHSDGLIWEKLNLDDGDPELPNTDGSVFTIYYRYDPVMQGYVVNYTQLVPASGEVEIVSGSVQVTNLTGINKDTHSHTHNYVSTVQNGNKAVIVGFLTDFSPSKTVTPPPFLIPLGSAGPSTARPIWWWGYYVPTQGDLNGGSLTMTFTVSNEVAQIISFEVDGLDTANPLVDTETNYDAQRTSIPSGSISAVRGGLTISGYGNLAPNNPSVENFSVGSNPNNFQTLHHKPLAASSNGTVGWLVTYHTAATDSTLSTPVYNRSQNYYSQMHTISLRPR
jgi:hypothetical protein